MGSLALLSMAVENSKQVNDLKSGRMSDYFVD